MVTWIILWFKLILSLKQLFWPPPRTFVTFGPFLSTLLIGWTENYLRKMYNDFHSLSRTSFFHDDFRFQIFLKMEALQIWFDLSDWISKANLNKLWSKKILPWRRSFINRKFVGPAFRPGLSKNNLALLRNMPSWHFSCKKSFFATLIDRFCGLTVTGSVYWSNRSWWTEFWCTTTTRSLWSEKTT